MNATMYDDQVLKIIEDLKNNESQEILKFICTKSVILGNGNDINGECFKIETISSTGDGTLKVEEEKQYVHSRGDLLDKSLQEINSSNLRERKGKIRSKKSPFTKFLQKTDVVEIAIRAPDVSDEEELMVITLLYEQLAIPTNETVSLFKLLIYYEQIQTFEMLLTYRMKQPSNIVEKNQVIDETQAEIIPGRNDDDNIYDYDEIISDAFSYAVTINHLHIAFYLLKTYEDDVYGNKLV